MNELWLLFGYKFIFDIRKEIVIILLLTFYTFIYANKTFQKGTCFSLSDSQWYIQLWQHYYWCCTYIFLQPSIFIDTLHCKCNDTEAEHKKNLIIFCRQISCQKFYFPGQYSVNQSDNAPCFVYATFNNKIYIYYNISLPRVESTNLIEVMDKMDKTHELLAILNITGNI